MPQPQTCLLFSNTVMSDSATSWTAACHDSLSITISQSLLRHMFIESVMPSNHLMFCLTLLLPSSIIPRMRVFSNESVPCTVQGILKSLHQHHSSKTSVLQHSAFFMGQLLHPYMTTGKTIALIRWTFVGKLMYLFFLNMVSRFVIAFLPRSKHLLISWLQSPSAVILEPKKINYFHCFPIYLPWSDGARCYDLSFLTIPVADFILIAFSDYQYILRLSLSTLVLVINLVSQQQLSENFLAFIYTLTRILLQNRTDGSIVFLCLMLQYRVSYWKIYLSRTVFYLKNSLNPAQFCHSLNWDSPLSKTI